MLLLRHAAKRRHCTSLCPFVTSNIVILARFYCYSQLTKWSNTKALFKQWEQSRQYTNGSNVMLWSYTIAKDKKLNDEDAVKEMVMSQAAVSTI